VKARPATASCGNASEPTGPPSPGWSNSSNPRACCLDNRYTLAALTKAGEAAAEEAERSHRRFQQQLLAGVAEHDRQAALRVLRQFRANAFIEDDMTLRDRGDCLRAAERRRF
jgi:hypothetical protein